MNADRARIMAKVRACLALGTSPEPHEAAAALRQAEALMRVHGITDADLERAQVQEQEAAAGRGTYVALHLHALADTICDVMGCRMYLRHGHRVVFVGVGPAPEIAAYAWVTLARRLQEERAIYRRRRTRGKAHRRTQRADAWALGWVHGVGRHIVRLAPPAIVERYLAERFPRPAPPADPLQAAAPARAIRRKPLDDLTLGHMLAGHAAGRRAGVQLHPGVGCADGQLRIGAQS